MTSTAAMDARILRHAPGAAEAIAAALLLSGALGEGYVRAPEFLAITPETGILCACVAPLSWCAG